MSFDSGLEGTVSIVTGGTRSIGEGIATALARARSTVYLTGSSTPDATAQKIAEETNNPNVIGIKLDHLDDTATAKFYESVATDQNGKGAPMKAADLGLSDMGAEVMATKRGILSW